MLELHAPPGCEIERCYTQEILFGEWLGLPCRLTQTDRDDISIRLVDHLGEIRMPDIFFGYFRQRSDAWLDVVSLPALPLPSWDSRELGEDLLLTDPLVPVLFGPAQSRLQQDAMTPRASITLPIDVLGSAFFMLSRYEEAVLPDRDNHDRFPATAALPYRAGFLDRPIIDEYVEILWRAMKRLWPALERKTHQARTLVSCDVDSPFAFDGSLWQMVRRTGGDLLRRRSLSDAFDTVVGTWQARKDDFRRDLHRVGIDYIMTMNEKAGRSVAFYFIPENTHARLDNRVSLDDPRMRALLREIHTRGHEIGIHPGYNTYRHPETMGRSVATLRRVLDEERIVQPYLGGRQHFLRWETPTTARLWDEHGLKYDSTLGFADRPGFRCGTCREYPLYDLKERRPLRVRERPLIVMECSIIAERYLGLGYSEEAFAMMRRYRDICHRFASDFTLLWHNSHLSLDADKRFYSALLD